MRRTLQRAGDPIAKVPLVGRRWRARAGIGERDHLTYLHIRSTRREGRRRCRQLLVDDAPLDLVVNGPNVGIVPLDVVVGSFLHVVAGIPAVGALGEGHPAVATRC